MHDTSIVDSNPRRRSGRSENPRLSIPQRDSTLIALALIALLFFFSPDQSYAYTCADGGVDSNFVFLDEKVVFIQATGGLTVLKVDTGEVVLRKGRSASVFYDGKLSRCRHGLLMTGYGEIAMLHPETFEPVWRIDGCRDASADSEWVVYHDGRHTLKCHDLQTGALRWTSTVDAGWKIVAANGKALAFTPRRCDASALMLFDLKSGDKLLHKRAPQGVRWLDVHVDGEFIYCLTTALGVSEATDKIANMLKLNHRGELVATVKYPSPGVVSTGKRLWIGPLIEDRVFEDDGRVRPAYPYELDARIEAQKQKMHRFDCLPSGVLHKLDAKDSSGEQGKLVRMVTAGGSWKLYLSHLGSRGYIAQTAEHDGRLLLGSTRGHVECIDISSGQPLWLYVFPRMRKTISYSTPHGMPPYLTELAATHQRSVAKMGETCGSVPCPVGFDIGSSKWSELRDSAEYPGRIIVDPSPDDPFPELGKYRAWLAFFVACPVLGVAVIFLPGGKKTSCSGTDAPPPAPIKEFGLALRTMSLLGYSVFPAVGLFEFGRVSYPCTIALKAVFAIAILAAAYGIVRLFLQRRWLAASVPALVMIAWVYFIRYQWWYS